MKNVKFTTSYRSNATDARTRERLWGEPAVAVTLQQTGETTRYISRASWLETVTPEAAAAVHVGKMNNNHLRYQCIIECKSPTVELHANMIAANGNAPLWYATETGYCSPSFANAKWHAKLESIFKMLEAAKVTVVITDADTGAPFDMVSVSGTRNELGRYVKRGESGKSPLLELIDEVTIRRKEYSNYPEKTGAPSAASVFASRY